MEYALFGFGNYAEPTTFNPLSNIAFLNSALDASEFSYRSPVLNFARIYKINTHSTSYAQLGRLFASKRFVFVSSDPVTMQIMLRDSPVFSRFPGITISSGSRLTARLRRAFEAKFQTEIYDNYGSSEFGKIAVECWKHDGLHFDPLTLQIDVVDINNKRILEQGNVGQLVITSSRNRALPLANYLSGDLGSILDAPCDCGSRWPRIMSLQGRHIDLFKRPDGELVNPFYLNNKFIAFPLLEWKLVQERHGKFTFHYLVLPYNRMNLSRLKQSLGNLLANLMGYDVELEFETSMPAQEPGSKARQFECRVSN